MPQLYVIVKSRDEVDKLMTPFDMERIVPNVVNIEELIYDEKQALHTQYGHLKARYDSKQQFINDHDQPNAKPYLEHVLNQIPLFLSNTKEGNDALWSYIQEQYDISNDDLLQYDNVLRRFNPNGKWDYYNIVEPPTSSHRVRDITEILTSRKSTLLLPNFLWIDSQDNSFTSDVRAKYLEKYKNYRYCLVEYHN